MKNFCIIVNQDKEGASDLALSVASTIAGLGGKAETLSTNEAAKVRGEGFTDLSGIDKDTEGVIIIGGDGTMIQAARELAKLDLPIIGINLGTIGFLTEVLPEEADEAVDKLIHDRYHIEQRVMLLGTVKKDDETVYTGHALNDIVVSRSGYSRIVSMEVHINGELLEHYRGDGVIVATPTGSTAYNLSAGGPILMPASATCVITPICPHSMALRSVVTDADDTIEMKVLQSKKSQSEEAIVSFDGNTGVLLETGDTISITKAKEVTKLIKLSEGGFISELKHKIG